MAKLKAGHLWLYGTIALFLLVESVAAQPIEAVSEAMQTGAARVLSAQVLNEPGEAATLGDQLVLRVRGLPQLVERAGGQRLIPFVDGMPLAGLTVYAQSDSTARFRLARQAQDIDTWRMLADLPGEIDAVVALSIGPENGSPIQTDVLNYRILLMTNRRLWTAILLLLVITFGFVWCVCRNKGLLRDPSDRDAQKRKYSLGRTQLAFWSALVLGSFVFIWIATGSIATLNESVLILIGIGAGTTLTATSIDSGRRAQGLQQSQEELDKVKTQGLTDEVKDLKTANLEQKRKALRQGMQTQGFFNDLAAGRFGPSINRIQMAAWTVVLGVIFVIDVVHYFEMPEFSATLLGLMGISSGTYVASKVPKDESQWEGKDGESGSGNGKDGQSPSGAAAGDPKSGSATSPADTEEGKAVSDENDADNDTQSSGTPDKG